MKIRMLMTVRPDFPLNIFCAAPGTILRVGEVYEATANKNGAVTAICENGERLGVKPAEFEFVSIPHWLWEKWEPVWPYSVEHAEIEQEEQNT